MLRDGTEPKSSPSTLTRQSPTDAGIGARITTATRRHARRRSLIWRGSIRSGLRPMKRL